MSELRVIIDEEQRLQPYIARKDFFPTSYAQIFSTPLGYATYWDGSGREASPKGLFFGGIKSAVMFFYGLSSVDGKTRKTDNVKSLGYVVSADMPGNFSVPDVSFYRAPLQFGDYDDEYFSGQLWIDRMGDGDLIMSFGQRDWMGVMPVKKNVQYRYGSGSSQWGELEVFYPGKGGIQEWLYTRTIGNMTIKHYVTHYNPNLEVLSSPGELYEFGFFNV